MRDCSAKEPAPLHLINSILSDTEYSLGRCYLESRPRYMTIVLGNGCNIDCPHCYQVKNGDNLLRNAEIGAELRREFMAIYPYLSTLRIQGGEVFALKGFDDLVNDIRHTTDRPLISISTNGVLMDAVWADRIVATPFQTVTLSFDGGTKETFERLRRGASFETVLENIRRIQTLKWRQNSWYPNFDAFFVVMRSNFREIPLFLSLLKSLQIYEATFQTMLVDSRNLIREPSLVDEVMRDPEEIQELHTILQQVCATQAYSFRRLAWSGLKQLFDQEGLDSDFLAEESNSLYTDQAKEARTFGDIPPPAPEDYDLSFSPSGRTAPEATARHCPNPWSTMFVTENGDVSLCFLSAPVANLYEMPLAEIWNCPTAVAKRSHLLAGRYTRTGCSTLWCAWRDGKASLPADPDSWRELVDLFSRLVERLKIEAPTVPGDAIPSNLRAMRRLLASREQRIGELEANLSLLWDDNGALHQAGRRHIDHLEDRIRELEATIARLEQSRLGL